MVNNFADPTAEHVTDSVSEGEKAYVNGESPPVLAVHGGCSLL